MALENTRKTIMIDKLTGKESICINEIVSIANCEIHREGIMGIHSSL